jgi:thiol reductant ABC exporter CydD subunit
LVGERAGELALSATRGVDALGVYYGRYLPQVVLAALVPVGLVTWVGVQDWVSGCVLVAMLGLVPLAMVFFGREASRRAGRQWRRLSSLSARYLELVQGLPTLRALGRSEHGRREVAASTEALRQTTMGTLRVAFLSSLATELLSGLGVGLVAMLLGLRLLGGSVGLAPALAILLVAPEVFLPLRRAGAEFHASTEGRAAATRLFDVLDLAVEDGSGGRDACVGRSATDASPRLTEQGTAGNDHDAIRHTEPPSVAVNLRGIVVLYPNRGAPALSLSELQVDPGEHLAVVGPSGSGKSTLLAVLLGLTRPDSGTVTLGGTDLSDVDMVEWRRRTTWVPQRTRLFRGSLLDNVRFSRPDASSARVDEAVRISGLDGLVNRLPRGLDTAVGEGGMTLSAGERQRVALARAVIRDAALVLLDEPASNLDPQALDVLEQNMTRWASGRTVVVAAHRSFLVPVDRVVALGGSDGAADGDAERDPMGAGW